MSSPNSSVIVLPNPFTPLAFFPPELAFQVSVANNVLVGSLAVMIWDMLNNIGADYKLLTRYRITISMIVYFISRFASLAYLLATTILTSAPVGHCAEIWKGVPWIYPIAVPATSLLFFLRVRAMYGGNKYIVAFFSFMWLAVVGGCLTSTQGVSLIAIGPTDYCINGSLAPYVVASGIIPLVNDTFIFVAITWRLLQNSYAEATLKNGVKNILSGKHLPAFSRALLHDGQAYYLSTVGVNFMTVVIYSIPSVPSVYRSIFGVPNIMLMNVLACRVYRNTKFGVFKEEVTLNTEILAVDRGAPSIPIAFGHSIGLTMRSLGNVSAVDNEEVKRENSGRADELETSEKRPTEAESMV
ncbi:hypothetical protein B0H34DRAFT_538909 [Crassisporium funariophilum]|nr:hypothetical protein B0H34DRAFT_538909 [Crassisporium funariophilum]